jgi:hypothetical protein
MFRSISECVCARYPEINHSFSAEKKYEIEQLVSTGNNFWQTGHRNIGNSFLPFDLGRNSRCHRVSHSTRAWASSTARSGVAALTGYTINSLLAVNTAYNALAADPDFGKVDFSMLQLENCGGASPNGKQSPRNDSNARASPRATGSRKPCRMMASYCSRSNETCECVRARIRLCGGTLEVDVLTNVTARHPCQIVRIVRRYV